MDSFTFTKETRNGEFYFLCSATFFVDSRNQNNFKCVSFVFLKRSSAKYAKRMTLFQVKLGSNDELKHILLKEGYLQIYGQYYNHIDIRLLLTVLDKSIAFT